MHDMLWDDFSMQRWLEKHGKMVYRLALNQTRNKADAEDIYQEVFLKLINRKCDFECEEHEKAWLLRVTINSCRKLLTSAWFRRTVPLRDQYYFYQKEKSDVFYAVMELPAKYRTVIHLFYYEDMSIDEISSVLSANKNTVKSQISRARELLKNKLEESGNN